MDLDSLSLRHLRYLVAAADDDTFTGAADRFGISQSAFSQAMARIETLTGQQLFVSVGRNRRLTQAGEIVVEHARRVVGVTAVLGEALEGYAAGAVGRLDVGMIDAVALYLAPDAITRFKRAHPGADVNVAVEPSQHLIARVLDHDLDAAVVVGPVDADLVAVPIVDEPLHLYRPADGDDRQWVLYPATSHTRRAIDRGLAERGIVPEVVAESSNPAVLTRLAEMEGASTVLPVEVAAGSDALVDAGVFIHRQVVAVHRPGDVTPLVADLIALLAGSEVATVRA